MSPVRTQIAKARLDSIDILRGAVMVIMALDHVRDYFSNSRINPVDPSHTYAALFFTRWITHFCAPVFVFLAGTGAFLYGSRRTRGELCRFLLTRGAWLILLELTVLRFAWAFHWSTEGMLAIVIWAIGWSMILLAGAIFPGTRAVAAIGLAIVILHNTVSAIPAAKFGSIGWLWTALFSQGDIRIAPHADLFIAYAIVPWFGVLCCGYAAGQIFLWPVERRRQFLRRIGAGCIALFLVLRWSNVYGDPQPWSPHPEAVRTLFSFLNCTKYPPSLLYLLMTLGPALLVLGYTSDRPSRLLRPLTVYGRVPFFYYATHIFLLHSVATVLAILQLGSAPWLFVGLPNTFPGTQPDPRWGYGLPGVYLFWIAIVAVLYPACAWFARLKERRRDWWLSYL